MIRPVGGGSKYPARTTSTKHLQFLSALLPSILNKPIMFYSNKLNRPVELPKWTITLLTALFISQIVGLLALGFLFYLLLCVSNYQFSYPSDMHYGWPFVFMVLNIVGVGVVVGEICLFGKHCLYINFFIGMQFLKMSLMCVMILWWFCRVLVDFTRLNPELWDMVALQ